MKLYLAIDQGGHASRALAFDEGGHLVAQGYAEIHVQRPENNRVEHDPLEMISATRRAIDIAAAALGARVRDVVSAGLATQRSNIVCWDRSSRAALSPIISWQDRRAAAWAEKFRSSEPRIHRLTGLVVSAHYGFSKLHWCLQHLPQVKQALHERRLAWGPMASFLGFHLLEERPLLVDPANASRTLLWNIETLDWDQELLSLFGLPAEPLPRCVATRYPYGTLRLGDHAVPLLLLSGDQSAALYAFGDPQPDAAYVNLGTGAFVQRLAGGYTDYCSKLLTSIVLQEGDSASFVLEGTVNGAGSALAEMERQLGLDSHTVQTALAHGLNSAGRVPLFLNGVSGLGAPYWVPNFVSRFIGDGTPQEKLVAVAESIIFLLGIILEKMDAVLSTAPQYIFATGGLARWDGLCQRLADIAQRPVYRPAECEATARGTAYLLAQHPLQWPEHAPGTWFQAQPAPALSARFGEWKKAMEAALDAAGKNPQAI